MTGIRSQLLLVCASAGVLVLAALVTASGQQPGRPDPERAHALGDSNLDGKLSLEEFRELVLHGPRQKAAAKKAVSPALLGPLFRRLDVDADGSLTVKEFARINELRGGAAGGAGPFAKKVGGPFMKGALARKKAAAPGAGGAKPKPAPAAANRPVTAEGAKFFETKIRPVLMNKCAKCHSSTAEKLKGGLLLDSREGLLKGGDTGAAIVPGNLDESLLITAIRYKDESLQMPPNGKLPQEVVADFEEWVKMGAPDPRGTQATKAAAKAPVDLQKARKFWSFQPPRMVEPPPVKEVTWPRTDIDRFLLGALEAKSLHPVADAERPTLIRRVTFDLTGLPPTPEEVDAFMADSSADAFKRVVEQLLASPRFGERWGRHWLDVARFAESSGKANMMYPNAWRYRDWVIAAFNEDKPFDAFVREQLAGDLLPAGDDRQRAELAIATGFLAIGSKTHNTQNRKQFVLDLADEQIDVTSEAFLGLTVACRGATTTSSTRSASATTMRSRAFSRARRRAMEHCRAWCKTSIRRRSSSSRRRLASHRPCPSSRPSADERSRSNWPS